MRRGAGAIADLIVRIQQAFLDTPGLALTPVDVQNRWSLDRTAAVALLRVLADGGVLTLGDDGAYRRKFPGRSLPQAALAAPSAA